MATTDEYIADDRSDGGRDPRRPPGLMLVFVAFVLLVRLGYAIYPHWREPALTERRWRRPVRQYQSC